MQSPLIFANISGKKVQADFDARTLSSETLLVNSKPF